MIQGILSTLCPLPNCCLTAKYASDVGFIIIARSLPQFVAKTRAVMAKLQIKYRLENKAVSPRPIKVEVPGWGGSLDFKKVNGSQPQPWHCPLHVEGATHGVELIYQYDQECHVVNDRGNIRIIWDRAAEGLTGPSEFTLSVPPPSVHFLF